ncbi:uncharacterized protein [Anabrus simplex]|uniref:uncharacterized protein n=1 Tax=Anabrus simplex TaxID=316456 RepID=UPI0035A386C4
MARELGVLCIVFLTLVGLVIGQEKYSDRYDNINIDEILHNDRLLKKYRECLNAPTDANCPEDGKLLRGVVGEGLTTDCAKCTDKQKINALRGVGYLVKNRPEVWREVESKYDPTGIYLSKHPELRQLLRVPVLVLLLAIVAYVAAEEEKYPSKYDSIDVDSIIGNDRLLMNYFKCLIEEKDNHCTDDGKFIKKVLSEGLKTNCAKCTDAQKEKALKIATYTYKNHRDLWDTVAAKYDPEGVFLANHPEVAA